MIAKKICMVGAFGVGKTSLVVRFVRSMFSDKYLTTIGVKIDKKQIVVEGEDVMLMLWDLAGKDGITEVKPDQLRGASGYILVADGCRASTLNAAIELQAQALQTVGEAPFVCVINKSDLRAQWEVGEETLTDLTRRGWQFLLTSAKTGEGVEQLFLDLAQRMLKESDVRPERISDRA